MRTIYNEGRVVGMSSYESYVRQCLSNNSEPVSEREWLAAALGWGNSMLLYIKEGTSAGYHDYVLPEGSDLCGCTTLFASIFEGDAELDSTGTWGIEVTDYGRLISNTPDSHPETPGAPENVPAYPNPTQHTAKFIEQCKEFVKITGGLMFQPGEWKQNVTFQPLLTEDGESVILTQDYNVLLATVPFNPSSGTMLLEPDLSERGFVRIAFSESIQTGFFIILTGLNMKTIMEGVQGFKSRYMATEPWNGDFLGPQMFPWAAKIIFAITIDVLNGLNMSDTEKINTLQSEVSSMQSQVASMQSQIATLQEQVASLLPQDTPEPDPAQSELVDTDDTTTVNIKDLMSDLSGDVDITSVGTVDSNPSDLVDSFISDIESQEEAEESESETKSESQSESESESDSESESEVELESESQLESEDEFESESESQSESESESESNSQSEESESESGSESESESKSEEMLSESESEAESQSESESESESGSELESETLSEETVESESQSTESLSESDDIASTSESESESTSEDISESEEEEEVISSENSESDEINNEVEANDEEGTSDGQLN